VCVDPYKKKEGIDEEETFGGIFGVKIDEYRYGKKKRSEEFGLDVYGCQVEDNKTASMMRYINIRESPMTL
jgi:hypothetical protein